MKFKGDPLTLDTVDRMARELCDPDARVQETKHLCISITPKIAALLQIERAESLRSMYESLHSTKPASELHTPHTHPLDPADAIRADPRWQTAVQYGKPRPGHPEGTVLAHIAELESNLEVLRPWLLPGDAEKLTLLILTHDTFKGEAERGVPILHPRSHASLAAKFLAEFTQDKDLLAMCQWHDEPYAVWRKSQSKGHVDGARLDALGRGIADMRLFGLFQICDNVTVGKDWAPTRWYLAAANDRLSIPLLERPLEAVITAAEARRAG